uniref:Transposase MuDR plant domain-containing protein n=1 Tax=Brassica oleracea var. oleracea TaxID=109376 RepID=A0A0D3EDT6_BRAOL
MAQEDYNLDMNTESVQLAYSLPEAMMQRMAPDTPPIHVTSDRQVRNLLEIAKTHEVRLCVSSLSKMRAVSEEGEENDEWDEADEGNKGDEGDEDDDDMAEDENHDEEEDDGDEDDGDEDADILVAAETVDDAEDYNEYGKVKDEDQEEEEDDMCIEDFKRTYGSEGGRSYGTRIYVNQSFASKDALVSELRLTVVRRKFSFRIYKSTKTLAVATCQVNGCGWKIRASVKHGTNNFWVTKYVENHKCSVGDRIAQRKHCTPKYVGRLFIDRVGIIDGLNLQHTKDAMKNMFGMTLDYNTSYRALLYVQELVRGSAEDGFERLPSYLEQISLANLGSMKWFFTKLASCVSDEYPLVIVSDRHTGIKNVCDKVFPWAIRGICYYHLQQNIVQKYKGKHLLYLVKGAAYAHTLYDFDWYMDEIRSANPELATYLENADVTLWSRVHCRDTGTT